MSTRWLFWEPERINVSCFDVTTRPQASFTRPSLFLTLTILPCETIFVTSHRNDAKATTISCAWVYLAISLESHRPSHTLFTSSLFFARAVNQSTFCDGELWYQGLNTFFGFNSLCCLLCAAYLCRCETTFLWQMLSWISVARLQTALLVLEKSVWRIWRYQMEESGLLTIIFYVMAKGSDIHVGMFCGAWAL